MDENDRGGSQHQGTQLEYFGDLYQRAREAVASGRLAEAEAAFTAHEQDTQALFEELRIREAELRLQNEDLRSTRQAREETLARFSAFFYSLPIAALTVNGHGLIGEINPAAETLFNLRRDSYQHPLFIRFVEKAQRGELLQALSAPSERAGVTLKEIGLRRPDGEPLIGDLHIASVPGEAGAEPEFICTVIDLSENVEQRRRLRESVASLERENAARRRAEQALQEREERLRLTLAATNDGLWDLDLRSGEVIVNERFTAMLGYMPGELELQFEPLVATVHPEDQPLLRARFEQHLLTGAPYGVDFRMRCKDGCWRWLHGRGQVVERDAEDQPLRVVGTNTDIHARKLAEQALSESNRRLREAERLAALGHWEYLVEPSELTWSPQLYRIFGIDPAEPLPGPNALAQLFHPDDAPEFLQKFHRALETGEPYSFTLRIVRRDGAVRWLFSEGRTMCDESGHVVRCFGTAQDVTEREQAQERLREAAKVFESTADGVAVTGGDHQIIAVNPAFTRITGYPEHAICGRPLEDVLASANDRIFWDRRQAGVGNQDHWHGERWERRQDESLYRARVSVTAVAGDQGQVDRYVIVINDTTRLHRTQQQVEFLSHYDPLTGLANRSQFRNRLTQSLQLAKQGDRCLAVLLLDLDRFRVVNESLGPSAAEQLLKMVATALSHVLRPTDTLARLGGDEFGIILPQLDPSESVVDVADRLQQACGERRLIAGQMVTITASIGIAKFPVDGLSTDMLMRHANVALKQAKARGRQSVQHFERGAGQEPLDRLHLEACLSQALLGDELQLHFQPQVQLGDGKLVGAEALLRWHSAALGQVSPQHFIPIAEDMGLIHEIGGWVLRQAAQQLAAWDQAGQRLPRLAVNLSILQFEDSDLVEKIADLLARYRLAPERLELELTESLLMRQAGRSSDTLDALRRLGVRLAIDDFGTGYSSLAYLHRLPLHQLKLDRSFVDPLPGDLHAQAIAQAVIALGDSLSLEVLAEGVETAEQAAWLRDAGCTLAQGYRYSRPLAPDAFAAQWLQHCDADTV